MTEIAAKDYLRWVKLAASPESGLASLLRARRKSAVPPRATPIQEWEGEGGSLPTAGALPAAAPD